ncbi:oligosaccharide flippase family protein [Desulfobacterium sp. N47]|uniref:Polysaccharide biosynthesis protein n=1 Tax=uncultured Desulfobacterium sp. TaxID=201089 RepID=E1YJL5_9BACT|nr:hypothetical protein N47_E49810 [uncultured Desulfobacterium sp.]
MNKQNIIPKFQDIIKLSKSTFIKNILVVMSGSAISQIVGFALTPIISRLYSPSDFGIFGSFNSVASIIAAGITLDYSQALMLPKDKEDAFHLFFISCLCTFIISFVLLIVCFIIPSTINDVMKTKGIWALALLVVATVVFGLNQSCQSWCIRVKAFKHTSGSQVIRSLSSNGTQIGLGFLKAGHIGLIISTVLGNILASLNLIRVLLTDTIVLRQLIRWDRMKKLAKEYIDFPMYSASQNIINALSSGLPVLILTHFYGIAVAGAYAFGIRILWTPMSFLIGALRQVLFQKAAEIQHQGGSLSPIYIKITAGLFAIAFLPSLVLFIWAPIIFTWIFGSQWQMAGDLSKYLILWMMFVFCNIPAVLFARLIRIQRIVFFYDLVLLVIRIFTLILGGLYLSSLHTVMLFSFVSAVMNLILILLVGYIVIRKERWVSKEQFL